MSLRHAIDAAVERHGFDAVVIDTQPGMTFLTISALLAATHIIIPTTADRLGVEAIAQDISFFDSLSTSFDVRWESEPRRAHHPLPWHGEPCQGFCRHI